MLGIDRQLYLYTAESYNKLYAQNEEIFHNCANDFFSKSWKLPNNKTSHIGREKIEIKMIKLLKLKKWILVC